jgi:putative hemolysin
MDIVLVAVLIFLNGIFAMSEIAVLSSRPSRLQKLADDGRPGARPALILHQNPAHFLAAVQVGMTCIGILNGAIGEAAFADPLTAWLSRIPGLAEQARMMALSITVAGLTYISVVVGELVPKRLALLAPESIAAGVSRPMIVLARIFFPLVIILSNSAAALLRLLCVRGKSDAPVSNDEIRVLMEQGAEAGVFHASEQALVANVLRLDEQPIAAIMTPRRDMLVIDLDDDFATVRQHISGSRFSRVIVCRDGLEHVLGILKTGDLLKKALLGRGIAVTDIESALCAPLFVPESVSTTQLLERFRHAGLQFALIVDEYGNIKGLVTLTDVLASIVGKLSTAGGLDEHDMEPRENHSWLVEGDVGIEHLRTDLAICAELPGEDGHSFHTLGGFIMHRLGRIPLLKDRFIESGWQFEVVGMDGTRVDKVLVSAAPTPESA